MGQSLIQIAQTLKDADKKLQIIYAFNGSGKTRLSREFKELMAPNEPNAEPQEVAGIKILYYNAFTEDLFYWTNDDRKLKIQPNSFTNWVLREQGQDRNIVENFQQLTNDKLTPQFNEDFTEVLFSFERGNENDTEFVKISRGEESCFIWSVFFSLMEQVVSVLNIAEKENRETDQYDKLEYIFIDDPVSSLDDTHLIELAVNISELIKSSTSDLKFIITTHNPLFYNVIFNEFNRVAKTKKWLLEKLNGGTFSIGELKNDSPFSYHLFLLSELEKAIQPSGEIKKFHFNFLRNILEKTSTFLGYHKWEELLPQESREAYYRRIINLSSHSKHNGEEISIVEENDKRVLGFLVNEIKRMYGFKPTINTSTTEQNVTI